MDKALNYSDIYLVPNCSELKSRSKANISVDFLGQKFKAPWLPANMQSVINQDIAKWLSKNDYFYIMHRFGDTQRFVEIASEEKWKTVSISIGVKNEDKILIDWISRGVEYAELYKRKQLKLDFITIDVAHAHHILVKEMIEFIKSKLSKVKIIAGNVATLEAVCDLVKWGADAVKVGVGGGGICSTKNMTGFHVPMFTCVQNCADKEKLSNDRGINSENYIKISSTPIISDGSIKENGDIAKALVAGATLVMAGGLFAACKDAPGENIYLSQNQIIHLQGDNPLLEKTIITEVENQSKILKKRYYGSASFAQKGINSHIEGFEVELPCNGLTFAEKYQELKESLSSSISYAGGSDLSCFKYVKWVGIK